MTIKALLAYAEETGEQPPLRVPGVLLRGDVVTTTRTVRPAEYARLWSERDIEGYLRSWVELQGERRCINCFATLPADSKAAKRFCSEKCRNADKQRRFRKKNPGSIEQAQKRYWESIDLEG